MKKKIAIILLIILIATTYIVNNAWAQYIEPGFNTILTGRFFTDFGYQNLSQENTNNKNENITTTFIQLSSSYLKSYWTSDDKNTGILIELGVSAKGGDIESIGLRYAYGWWKNNNYQLVAGQTDSWVGSSSYGPRQELGSSLSAKNQLRNFGFIYSGRSPQVRLEWKYSNNFSLSIAAIQPAAEQIATISATDIYADYPRFDIAAEFKTNSFLSTPGLGWSQIKYQGIATGSDYVANSWITIIPIKYSIGGFTTKIQAHTGINTETEWLGESNSAMGNSPKIIPMFYNGEEYDSKEIGGMIALEYQIGSLITTTGYGTTKIENEHWKTANGYKNDHSIRSAWFIAIPFIINKNFSIQPEYVYYMFGENPKNGKELGTESIGGIQIRFIF